MCRRPWPEDEASFCWSNFSFNNLVPKIAMHRLNLDVVGFSSPRHGFSNTAFGVRYLNRLYRDMRIDISKSV